MAQRNLSYAELKDVITAYVDENKVSNSTYKETRDNTAELLDKIAKIVSLDTSYTDKLSEFDGEYLSFGKDIEEWQEDLIPIEDYDAEGKNALAPADGSYRPNFYSKTLGRKTIKQTIRNNDLERAVHFIEHFELLIARKSKKMYDSEASFKYGVKRELLNDLIKFADAMKTNAVTKTTSNVFQADYNVNDTIKIDDTYYNVMRKYKANTSTSLDEMIKIGYLVAFDLVKEMEIPTDTATADAFIKQVKIDDEIASDENEGHSLNCVALGNTETLMCILKQGVSPVLDVDSMAGAFNEARLTLPAISKVIKDFGSDKTGVFAMLIDSRMVRLHNSYRAVRDQGNADGDFVNYVLHTENTGWISRNAFLRIYRAKGVNAQNAKKAVALKTKKVSKPVVEETKEESIDKVGE